MRGNRLLSLSSGLWGSSSQTSGSLRTGQALSTDCGFPGIRSLSWGLPPRPA